VLDLRAVRAFALNDRPGHARAIRELLAQPSLVPRRLALEVAVQLDDMAASERFARLLTTAPGPCDVQALGHRMLAQVALARGQVGSAGRELAAAGPCDPAAALELRALMDAQPFFAASDSELVRVRRVLDSSAGDAMDPDVRAYHAALISLRLGDTLRAMRTARALSDTRARGPRWPSWTPRVGAHGPAFGGRSLGSVPQCGAAARARSRRRGDRLVPLDGRAGLLRAGLSGTGGAAAGADLRPPRRPGGRPRAHYRRFAELWRSADPALQPAVAEAERRAAALGAGVTAEVAPETAPAAASR
jgi:hypothetical protein